MPTNQVETQVQVEDQDHYQTQDSQTQEQETQEESKGILKPKPDVDIDEFVDIDKELDEEFAEEENADIDGPISEEDDVDEEEEEEVEYGEEEEEDQDVGRGLYQRPVEDDADLEEASLKDADDNDILLAAIEEPSFAEYLDSARDLDIEVADDFVVKMAKEEVDPKFLMEREIYGVEDFIPVIQDLEEKTDPDAVYVPKDTDSEEFADFMHERIGIPKSSEEYTDDIFGETFLEGRDPEEVEDFKEWAFEGALTKEQTSHVVQLLEEERALFKAKEQERYDQVEKETREMLSNVFKDDAPAFMDDAAQFMNLYGTELLSKYGDSEVVNSVEFYQFLNQLMSGDGKGGKANFTEFSNKLRGVDTNKLLGMREKLYEEPFSDVKYAESRNVEERKKYRRIEKRLSAINNILYERGIE